MNHRKFTIKFFSGWGREIIIINGGDDYKKLNMAYCKKKKKFTIIN